MTKDQQPQEPSEKELARMQSEAYGPNNQEFNPVMESRYLRGEDMANDKATPRPWEYDKDGFIHHNTTILGEVFNKDNDFELFKANANLIVKAVNCHDELVEALKYALEMARQGAIPNDDDSWYKEAKQALAKAGE